jgi:hypothetical protein
MSVPRNLLPLTCILDHGLIPDEAEAQAGGGAPEARCPKAFQGFQGPCLEIHMPQRDKSGVSSEMQICEVIDLGDLLHFLCSYFSCPSA